MNCEKCGTSIEKDEKFCSKCGYVVKRQDSILIDDSTIDELYRKYYLKEDEVERVKSKLNTVAFILSIASISLSLVAFYKEVMITGIVIGLISLTTGILLKKKNPLYNKINITMILSISGVLSNLSWLIFSEIILPKL
jgi:hypothetical protein